MNRVLVHDIATDRKWYFLCNSWMAIDMGDCVLDKVFPVATEQDMKQFRYIRVTVTSICRTEASQVFLGEEMIRCFIHFEVWQTVSRDTNCLCLLCTLN